VGGRRDRGGGGARPGSNLPKKKKAGNNLDGAGTYAGMIDTGDKNISFLAETILKLRFLWSFHLFGHHAILQVGPA
jgi:hypothetical protein